VDAALFNIDPLTGVLTFKTAPNFLAPADVGADNVYDVIVQASDGAAADTQAISVTITQVPPAIVLPPPPPPSPTTDPPPGDHDTGTETPLEDGPQVMIPFGDSPSGPLTGVSHGSTDKAPRNADGTTLQNLNEKGEKVLPGPTEGKGLMEALSEALENLRGRFDPTAFPGEIRALLTRSEFLQDLDRVREAFNGLMATEKIYMASSVATATGLSIGYVIWLLRSGVLLTALLSSVPAWQFVNPLLVLTNPDRKRKKGQDDSHDDSLESMFENHTESADTSETKTGLMLKAQRFLRHWRH
jgi:hypothetical protein